MTDPVSLERISKLVGNVELLTATPREREIAAKVRHIGQHMEREGYLPDIRRAHMMRVMQTEAAASDSGAYVPLCMCGSAKAESNRDGSDMRCARCGGQWRGASPIASAAEPSP